MRTNGHRPKGKVNLNYIYSFFSNYFLDDFLHFVFQDRLGINNHIEDYLKSIAFILGFSENFKGHGGQVSILLISSFACSF